MNVFKKVFCRVYQIAFRAALPLLPYREPKIFDSVEATADILLKLNVKRALLVTDAYLRNTGATEKLEESLTKNNINIIVYDRTCANPTVQNVEEARELYISEKCEALIAFGGGSPIDCAKAVGARIAYPKKSVNKLGGILKVMRKIPTLIAIPTTAGTGSEVTLAAVITDGETRHKYPINSFPLIPRYAILDPEVTYSLPPHLTATTGMDALTHATEAFIGRSTSRETRAKALEAVSLIFNNIEKAYTDGRDREARENMLRAAYLAGVAFSKSYVGYIHAVAHSLGGQYNIPHGLANSVLMPVVLDEYGKKAHKKLHRLGVAAGVALKTDSHAEGAAKYIEAVKALNSKMCIPNTLKGIREEDISMMAKHADREANPLYPVPVVWGRKDFRRLIESIRK